MLELYDVTRDRVYWININQIVSLTAVDKANPKAGTHVDINGHPQRITVNETPKSVIESIELVEFMKKVRTERELGL